jgi:hypothetical protein
MSIARLGVVGLRIFRWEISLAMKKAAMNAAIILTKEKGLEAGWPLTL